jgi:DNA-binding transcriptional regulator YhcF (GntR family)
MEWHATESEFRVDREDELPLGAQLARKLRSLISAGRIASGERLPSVRKLAELAGVNVNTVRAVYQRLENEGVLVSEQGRGTFVAKRSTPAPAGDRVARADLRRQIARLERELVRYPQPPGEPAVDAQPRPAEGLLTTDELARVRDELVRQLAEVESTRADLLEQLSVLGEPQPEHEASPREGARRHSTSSLGAVKVRWVGGA